MRVCNTICLIALFLVPGFCLAQNGQQQPNQQQTRNQVQGNRAGLQNQTAPQNDTPQPPRTRTMSAEEAAAYQRALEKQNAPNVNYQPQLPDGFPLPADHTAYVNDVLDFWQKSSSQIKRSTCEFRRFDYNPEFCAWRDPKTNHLAPFSVRDGEIRFAAPDKGRIDTTDVWSFEKPPEKAGEDASYKKADTEAYQERWICDGRAIFEYDYVNKRLNETTIPAEMQGSGLANSPLPFFLFGANKEQILQRYWVKPLKAREGEYKMMAYPKRASDARNYSRLEISLDARDGMPQALQIFASNYDAKRNPSSMTFEFKNRKGNSQLAAFQDFMGGFVRPRTPIGWKRVNINQQAELEMQKRQQQQANQGRSAAAQNQPQNQQTQPRR